MSIEMTAGEATVALGEFLDLHADGWEIEYFDLGEINATNAKGEKFLLIVEAVDRFPSEG